MIRTKQHADLHVADTLKRIKTKQEKLLRGYQFAKLYVSIKEYEKAKEYLQGFLSVKDNSAPGHKLLGEILEAQHHLNEAAAAYTKSLNIDQLQKDVLLKICDIYSQINISPDLARVWAEKGERAFPTNDAVFKLKMKAHVANGDANSPEEMLSFLVAESAKCPSDPIRRVKLLRSFMDLDRINEAYTHVVEIELKNLHYDSLDWYRCVTDVLKKYRETSGSNINGKFHQMLLSATNRLAALSIEHSLTIAEAINALWSLDQELAAVGLSLTGASDEMKVLYQELEAQYLFHCGTLILNKAQKERLSWREASELAYACFLVSHSVSAVDRKACWYAKANAESQSFYDKWYSESCYRCSQTGHMLMQKYQGSDGGQKWIERIQDEYCHQLGQDKIFNILFTQPQQKDGKKQSYLARSSLFSNKLAVPDKSLLMEWDSVVHTNNPENLQLAVWTCLHYYSVNDKTQPKYPFTPFERLPYGARNLDTAAPESLCQLDVLAFLYATVRCAALKHSERCCRYDPYRPNMLPLPISEKLCTETQREWWTSAYKLHTNNARDSLVKMRAALQKGLETIRLLGTNLGMDAGLVVHLAQTFTEQLEESKSQFDSSVLGSNDNVPFLQARAVHYWNKAIDLLEMLEKKRSVSMQRNPLFDSGDVSLSPKHVSVCLDEGKLFQAMEAKGAGRHAQAIKLFGQIKSADASFQSALLHRELAIIEQDSSQSESSSRARDLLLRAKSDLYETLDRLKGDRHHILNERVAEEIDDVETRLMRLEGIRGNVYDDEEDEHRTDTFSGIERLDKCRHRKRQDLITHSTPQVQRSFMSEVDYSRSETRLRPSPDRLDAQIRSLSHGQDQWIKIIMDEMKDHRTTIQKLQERVTLLESKLQDTVDQLKQYQTVAMAAAVTAQPPAAMATQQPTAIMYQPSPFRGEGYEYWGSHVYDPAAAIHGNLYRGYQQTLPAAYGVAYTGMTPKGVQLPSHFTPSSTRLDTDDYAGDSYAFSHDHGHDLDQTAGQEVIKGTPVGYAGLGSVSALQPGYFSIPKLVANENEIPDTGVKQGYVAPKPTEEQRTGVFGKSDGPSARASDSVIAIPNRPGVFKAPVPASSAERVLPVASSIVSGVDGKQGASIPVMLNRSSESQGGGDGLPEDEYTEPHFEPIVTLPEVVDLKTGEEDETVLFSDRVKLFRFADKQWKERGVGLLKILHNEKTLRARILMRREQVHVVCANQSIRPDTTVEKKTPGEGKVLTWHAVDCSDGEPQLQQFCCRFKSDEVATQFVENFNRAKRLITGAKADGQVKAPQISVPQIVSMASASVASSEPSKASIFSTTPSSVGPATAGQGNKPMAPLFGTVTSASVLQPGKPIFSALQPNSAAGSGFSFSPGAKFGEVTFPNARVSVAASSTPASSSQAGMPLFSSPFTAGKSVPSATQTSSVGSAFSVSKFAPGIKTPLFTSLSTSSANSATSVGSLDKKLSAETSVSSASSKPSISSSASDSALSTAASALNFGGFTFTKGTAFAVAEKTSKDEKKEPTKPTPPNPFANFSFVKTNAGATNLENVKPSGMQGSGFGGGVFSWPASGQGTLAQILKGDQTDSKTKLDNSTPSTGSSDVATTVFGQSSTVAGLSFENVTSGGSGGTFQTKKVDDIFKNKGQRLFETTKNSEVEVDEGNGDSAEDYVPDRSFEAIVSLPEVEVMTGEENESKLFGERAKLYRMDNDLKQWKERGIGEIKILQHNVSNKFRILMRREQVLKVCANHYITSKMSLLPMKASENAWCWFARDFSEQEIHEEQLAVKFKTAEQAEDFKRCFENCQRKLTKPEVSGNSAFLPEKERAVLTDAKIESSGNAKGVESSSVSLAAMFKPKEGEWACDSCYVKNVGTSSTCVACQSPKPGSKVESIPVQGKIETVGPASSLADLFKPKEGEWQCDVCYVKNDRDKTKCLACETPKPGVQIDTQPSDANPSVQVKFGPSGGFMLNTGQVMSFGKGFGSTASDSGKGGMTADTKPVGFGQVTSGFTGFTFGNVKAGGSNDNGQPSEMKGKSESIPKTDSEITKPIFGGFGTTAATASKPFGSSAFTFSGKGFTLGTTTTESQKPDDASTTKSDAIKPVFGSSASTSSSNVLPAISSAPSVSSSTSVSTHKVFGTQSFSFAGVTAKESSPFLAPSGMTTPIKTGASAAALSPASPKSPDSGFYKNTEGEDDHIVFEPIVKLPENVEVKTGEEDEEVLYSQRAKLYRFSGNEWKERGVGDVKILQRKDGRQIRLLMRREKVLKICMNHRLCPDMSLKQMPNTEGKAWTWHATDYADGESMHESFSIRFKDSQIASEFRDAFNKALEHVKALKGDAKEGTLQSVEEITSSDQSLSASNQQAGNRLLLDLLKKPSSPSAVTKTDSDCELVSIKMPSEQLVEKARQLQLPVYFYNYLEAPDCPGCCGCDPDSFDFSKIGKLRQEPTSVLSSATSAVIASPRFVFASSGGKADSFKPAAPLFSAAKPSEAPATTISSALPAPSFGFGSTFVFGGARSGSTGFGSTPSLFSATQKQDSQEQNASKQSNIFGSVGRGVDFASLASGTTQASSFAQSKSNPDFKWEGAGSTLFGGTKTKTQRENEGDEDESGGEGPDQDDEDGCGITFTPVVQLPEVEVKTGEEEEREVFRERGKLYRFDNEQWKERGVGDMKIMKHELNKTFRLLLRREQVHKVACNHLLTVDMKLQAMSTAETAWCWFAHDYSDGEAKLEKFALKFKTKDIADKFKEKFEECQKELSQPDQSTGVPGSCESGVPPSNRSSQGHPVTAVTAVPEEAASTESREEEEDEEQSPPLFSKRAQLKYKTDDGILHDGGIGCMMASVDDDVSGYRLRMETDGNVLVCNHIICKGYEIKSTRSPRKYTCEWTALDFSSNEPIRKTFQVAFSSEPALVEFEKVFRNGVEMAKFSELSESRSEDFNPRPDERDEDDDSE